LFASSGDAADDVAVFTFVVLLFNVLKESTVARERTSALGLILEAIGLLIPFAVVYALPMGHHGGVAGVRRFSADQELTAARRAA